MLPDPVLLNDWHVVGRASQLPVGGILAARLLGVELVVWRNAEGIQCWRDQCRHRGARLTLGRVRDDCLVCCYHGWTYDSTGRCTLVPAHAERTASLDARAHVFQVRVRYDLIWVCLGAPARDVPEFPEWDDGTYHKVAAGPYRFRAYAPRVLEDFLDPGHYPFVHARHAGFTANVAMSGYGVKPTEFGLVTDDISVRRIWRDGPDGTGEVDVAYSYRVLRPLTAQYVKAFGGERFAMLDTVTPVGDAESLVWSVMAYNYPTGKSDAAWVEYQDILAGQDAAVVESQSPQLLPLDMGQEVAVPSDSLAVAYRQWLRTLGVRFGTS